MPVGTSITPQYIKNPSSLLLVVISSSIDVGFHQQQIVQHTVIASHSVDQYLPYHNHSSTLFLTSLNSHHQQPPKMIIFSLFFFLLATAPHLPSALPVEEDFAPFIHHDQHEKEEPGPNTRAIEPTRMAIVPGTNFPVVPPDKPLQLPPSNGPLPVGAAVYNDTGPVSTRRSQYLWGEAEWSFRNGRQAVWSYLAMELDHYPGSNEGDVTYCWAGGDEVASVTICQCKTNNNWRRHNTVCVAEYVFDDAHLIKPRLAIPNRLRIRFHASWWDTDFFRRFWGPFLPDKYIKILDCDGPKWICKEIYVRKHDRQVSRYNRRHWWRHFPTPCVPTDVYKC